VNPKLLPAILAAAIGATPQPAGAEPLTVVTINVWSGLTYKGSLRMGEYEKKEVREQRMRSLVKELRVLRPDVVAVNEANPLPRYAKRLAGELGFGTLWHVGVGGLRAGPVGLPGNLREGDVLLARRELGLRSAGRRQLSGGPVGNFFTAHLSDATQVVAGRVRVGGREVALFCTHWHASAFPTASYRAELERRRDSRRLNARGCERAWAQAVKGREWRLGEARGTLEFVEQVAGNGPAILLGDFNAPPDSDEIGLLLKAGFVDAFAAAGTGAGTTWDEDRNANIRIQRIAEPGTIPEDPATRRIDYIFVRGAGLSVRSASVVLDRPVDGVFPSDHYGVLAEIEVR
jgi:endonuclease/exonuclease/phosphatase family metal-dependent hydrolase